MPSPITSPLLTVSDAAAHLRVGRTKIFELIACGELPTVRLGPRILRVSAAALDGFIAAHQSNAA